MVCRYIKKFQTSIARILFGKLINDLKILHIKYRRIFYNVRFFHLQSLRQMIQ